MPSSKCSISGCCQIGNTYIAMTDQNQCRQEQQGYSGGSQNMVTLSITDYGGITNGTYSCYADKVNDLTNLEEQIKIADAAWSACMSSGQIGTENCPGQCSSASDPNTCEQQCINNYYATCNSSHVGDLRMQLAKEVSQDCP
jgi:hypothetical protein